MSTLIFPNKIWLHKNIGSLLAPLIAIGCNIYILLLYQQATYWCMTFFCGPPNFFFFLLLEVEVSRCPVLMIAFTFGKQLHLALVSQFYEIPDSKGRLIRFMKQLQQIKTWKRITNGNYKWYWQLQRFLETSVVFGIPVVIFHISMNSSKYHKNLYQKWTLCRKWYQ